MPWYRDRALWVRVLPFLVFMAFLAARGHLPADNAWGLDPRWLYAVGALVVGAMLFAWRREYGELSAATAPASGEWALAVAVGGAVFLAWVSLDAPWMVVDAGVVGFVPLDGAGAREPALIAARWAGASLLVPVMEELFWRSFLMRWVQQARFTGLVPQAVGWRAIVLSTFAFVLAHAMWLAALVAGLAYAWLYVRTGRLWVAVLAHAVTNGALGAWVIVTGQWRFW